MLWTWDLDVPIGQERLLVAACGAPAEAFNRRGGGVSQTPTLSVPLNPSP